LIEQPGRKNRVSVPMMRPICVLLAATALSGCGWFESSPTSPLQTQPLRPGADRQTTAAGLPAAPHRGGYDGGQPPLDETRDRPVGAVVTTKGGQKAQLETRDKENAQREAEQNRKREEERQAKAKEAPAQPAAPPANPPAADPSTPPAPAEPQSPPKQP
jgi:hypothetical protein